MCSPLDLAPPRSRSSAAWLAGSVAGALLLGAFRLGDKSLWVDEAASAGFALGKPETWLADHNMALYYALLGGWVRVFGISEVALRSLSVLCFAGSIAGVHHFARTCFGERTARLAALFCACNPFLVHFAQEARGYGLAALLVLLSHCALVHMLEQRQAHWALIYGVTVGLAAQAHLLTLFVTATHACLIIPALWRRELPWQLPAIALPLMAALIAPLVWHAALAGALQISWIKPVSLASVAALPVVWSGGCRVLAAVSCALLAWLALGRRDTEPRVARYRTFVLAWLLLPIAIAVSVSRWKTPVLLPKYLIGVVPTFGIGAALVIAQLPKRTHRVSASLALLMALGFLLHEQYGAEPQEQWRETVAKLAAQIQPTDELVLELPCPEPFTYYVQQRGLAAHWPKPVWPARGWEFPIPNGTDDDQPLAAALASPRIAGTHRIWVVGNRLPLTASPSLLRDTHIQTSQDILTSTADPLEALYADTQGRTISLQLLTHKPPPAE